MIAYHDKRPFEERIIPISSLTLWRGHPIVFSSRDNGPDLLCRAGREITLPSFHPRAIAKDIIDLAENPRRLHSAVYPL